MVKWSEISAFVPKTGVEILVRTFNLFLFLLFFSELDVFESDVLFCLFEVVYFSKNIEPCLKKHRFTAILRYALA